METFGFIYVISFFIDVNVSILALLFPVLLNATTITSHIMLGLSGFVLCLTLLGRLKPRKVFIPLSLLHLLGLAIGFVLVFALAIKLGPDNIPKNAAPAELDALFTKNMPWFTTIRWIIVGLGEIFAIYGLKTILDIRKNKQLTTPSEITN